MDLVHPLLSRLIVCTALAALLAPRGARALTLVNGPILVAVGSDSATLTWETDEHQSNATVSYGTVSGQRSTQAQDPNDTEQHHLQLTGLSPNTTYYYSIDTDSQNQESRFTTAPAAGAGGPIKFVVYGDNRTNASDHQSVVNALVQEPGISFAIQTGDMAQDYLWSQQWDTFFSIEHDLLRVTPLFPTIGNHETLDALDHWSKFFAAPDFSLTNPTRYYSADWGNIHLTVLDVFESLSSGLTTSDSMSAAQIEWMKSDLDAAVAAGQVIFVSIHHGAYSHAVSNANGTAHGGSDLVRTQIMPELAARNVTAVFAGHDHIYERGCNGDTDYFVEGGGGAPLYGVDPSGTGVLSAAAALSYMVVTVDGNSVTGVAKSVSGATATTIDTFSLPTPACTHAAVALDGGSAPDAGPVSDAGNGSDAGNASDAGSGSDAGSTGDAGTGSDAGGASADAGDAGSTGAGAPDAGPALSSPASSCSQGGDAFAWLALPLLAALALRRRRAVR